MAPESAPDLPDETDTEPLIPAGAASAVFAVTDPVLASRYQIVILFLIAASVTVSSLIAVLAALWHAFDRQHRLRPERIRRVSPP